MQSARAVAAESLLLKHKLLISNRSRQPAPNLTSVDRFVLALATSFVRPHRLPKLGARARPATLLKFHEALAQWKYRRLFSASPSPRRKPGLKGPSWLTFIAQAKDSLWSVDLFRCESIRLHSHWVLVVVDVFTRRIIGFGIERGSIDGISVCRMFIHAVTGRPAPKHVSTDHDPLFRFHRWRANLRVREIGEVKSVPDAPVSHPFVERPIGTIRRKSWRHSGITTTTIACIERSRVSRRRSSPAPSAPLPLHWTTTVGSSTVRACSSSRSLPDHDLATDRPHGLFSSPDSGRPTGGPMPGLAAESSTV
jgi:hypothetical protein